MKSKNVDVVGSSSKNLVYLCVFRDQAYVDMFAVFLESVSINYQTNGLDENTDILVFTQPTFKTQIEELGKKYNINMLIHTIHCKTVAESKYARLFIFDVPMIHNYDKILYLDTDIITTKSLTTIFQQDILKDKLYAVRENTISTTYHGKHLFDFSKVDQDTPAFNSGVLLFRNSLQMKELFACILQHIQKYEKEVGFVSCVDQPFFNYHAILRGMNEIDMLSRYSTNNPNGRSASTVICHFAGTYGDLNTKVDTMISFLGKKI
jgi:lipopolysaccharide biosynthesis glycosyltransferase